MAPYSWLPVAAAFLVSMPQDREFKITYRPADVTTAEYDVRDLIENLEPLWTPSFARSTNVVERDFDGDGDLDLYHGGRASAANLLELARLLKAFSDPRFEESDRIDCHETSLGVTAGARQQAFVREFLDLQRKCEDVTQISMRLISGEKDSFAKLGLPISGTYATPAEVETLLARMKEGFDILNAPTVTTRILQRADISTLSSFSYVKEYHVQIIQPSGELIADPVIDVIDEGVVCRVRSIALPGGVFGLTIDIESVEVLRPVPTKNVRIAAGVETEGEIMLPEVLRARLSGDMRLADGATAVFVTPLKEDQDLALFLSIARVPAGDR